jgi:CxC2 like cysteine cluster associated with KDZ transposases
MQFEEHFDDLLNDLLATEYDPAVLERCSCGRGDRNCRCVDCFQTVATCSHCFIDSHIFHPFHWVDQWNGKHFLRKDISALGHVIALEHNGGSCPNAQTEGVQFTVVETNGIHSTRIIFCQCLGSRSRTKQLMSARLFPATMAQPTTAFSFRLLKEFHIHSLESKKAAYDYIGAIRRLTDNAFTPKVPVYTIFLGFPTNLT